MVPPMLILVLVTLSKAVSAEDVVCTSDFEKIVSEDCKTLYQCDWGKPVKMPACPDGLVYSRQSYVCVHEGGEHDDCTAKTSEYAFLQLSQSLRTKLWSELSSTFYV
jgi:hypothetical protein